MSDLGDDFRAMKQQKREWRDKHTVDCPGCPTNRSPTKLYEGQTCSVCGYQRPKKEKK